MVFFWGEKAAHNSTSQRAWQTERVTALPEHRFPSLCAQRNCTREWVSNPLRAQAASLCSNTRLRRGVIRFANEFSVQSFILLSRHVPGEIAGHRSHHQLRPEALVAEDIARPFHCVPKSVA